MTSIQVSALRYLRQHKVKSLPVDALQLLCQEGFTIADYTSEKVKSLEDICGEKFERRAFIICSETAKAFFYRPDITPDELQNLAAHELGHLLVQMQTPWHGDAKDEETLEKEANEFMRSLRAPLPVLYQIGAEDTKTIASISGLDMQSAKIVAGDLKKYKDNLNVFKLSESILRQFAMDTVKRRWKRMSSTAGMWCVAACMISLPYLIHFIVPSNIHVANLPITPANAAMAVHRPEGSCSCYLHGECPCMDAVSIQKSSVSAVKRHRQNHLCQGCFNAQKEMPLS